jgi:hypothetical protein
VQGGEPVGVLHDRPRFRTAVRAHDDALNWDVAVGVSDHGDRAGGVLRDAGTDRTQQQAEEDAAAVRSHDEQVGTSRSLDQHDPRIADRRHRRGGDVPGNGVDCCDG